MITVLYEHIGWKVETPSFTMTIKTHGGYTLTCDPCPPVPNNKQVWIQMCTHWWQQVPQIYRAQIQQVPDQVPPISFSVSPQKLEVNDKLIVALTRWGLKEIDARWLQQHPVIITGVTPTGVEIEIDNRRLVLVWEVWDGRHS